jgi:hypothetical protein
MPIDPEHIRKWAEDIRKWDQERAQTLGIPSIDEMVKSNRTLTDYMDSGALDRWEAEGARMRRKAQVDQATIDSRDLAIQQTKEVRQLRGELRQVNEELRRTREESDTASRAESRRTRLYFWWSIVATVLVGILGLLSTVLGVLLAR